MLDVIRKLAVGCLPLIPYYFVELTGKDGAAVKRMSEARATDTEQNLKAYYSVSNAMSLG